MKPVKKVEKPKAVNKPKTPIKLGGIFDINNGWDNMPPEPEKKSAPIQKIREPPKIERPLVDQSVLDDAHNTFFDFSDVNMNEERLTPDRDGIRNDSMINNRKFNQIRFEPEAKVENLSKNDETSQSFDKFNRFDSGNSSDSEDDIEPLEKKEEEAASDSESEEEEIKRGGHNKRLLNDSESDEEPKKSEKEESEDESQSPKRQKLSEDPDDSDLLLMENDNLDDLDSDGDEYIPPKSYQKQQKPPPVVPEDPVVFTSELDELHMKIVKEKVLTAEEEFAKNTQKIMDNMPKNFSDAVSRSLNKFFPGICTIFIDGKTCDPRSNCPLKHQLLALKDYQDYFEKRQLFEIDEFFGLCVGFPLLLEFFFSLFAELFVLKTKDKEEIREIKIARLIMECERSPRLQSKCYRQVIASLERDMPRYKALQILIKHHQVSDVADELLLPEVVEIDVDLFRFLPYLESVLKRRVLPTKIIDKIISNCVEYENFKLSMFCINNLITRTAEQFRQLNKENITNFLKLQTMFVDIMQNQNYKSKVGEVAMKSSSSQLQQSRFR